MSAMTARNLADLSAYEVYAYATYIPGRSEGLYKRHKTLGQAHNAVTNRQAYRLAGKWDDIVVYKWNETSSAWVEIERYKQ